MGRTLPVRVGALALVVCSLVAFEARAAEQDSICLSGCWSGSWNSCTTGHRGPLHASFCKLDETRYQVHFRGRFFKIVPFRYSVVLNVVGEQDGKLQLAGSNYLGRLFGTFHYTAEATETSFVAQYSSCKDSGYFSLCRSCCR